MTTWMDDALCAEVGPTLFHGEGQGNHSTRLAKQVCARCTVVAACLEYGLTHVNDEHGVYGGLTAKERRRVRKQRAEEAA